MEALIPVLIVIPLIALLCFAVWIQHRAVQSQRRAIASVLESIEIQKRSEAVMAESAKLQSRSVELEEQILSELKKLNGNR